MLMQPLERRLLLAASYTFESRVLSIRGTNRRDDIEVYAHWDLAGSGVTVGIDGVYDDLLDELTIGIPLDQVIIHGRGGRDRIRVGHSNHGASVTVRGGSGADEIFLDSGPGGHPAFVSGGRGPDYIRLADGLGFGDVPRASAWHEPATLHGGGGDDQILVYSLPNSGFDIHQTAAMRISGGPGNDRIFSGAGDDLIDAGPGHDTLAGQIGNDTLLGRQGDDRLVGSRGDDLLVGGPGHNTLVHDSAKPNRPKP